MTNLKLVTSNNELMEVYLLTEQYRDLDRQIKALTKEKEIISSQLKDGFFADHDHFTYNNRLLMTCTTQISERMDTTRIKAERPDIYSLYQVESVSRVLRLK